MAPTFITGDLSHSLVHILLLIVERNSTILSQLVWAIYSPQTLLECLWRTYHSSSCQISWKSRSNNPWLSSAHGGGLFMRIPAHLQKAMCYDVIFSFSLSYRMVLTREPSTQKLFSTSKIMSHTIPGSSFFDLLKLMSDLPVRCSNRWEK